MIELTTTEISGWGRTSRVAMDVAAPIEIAQLSEFLANSDDAALLATGNHRSYADQGVCTGGVAVSTLRLDAVESFDEESGLLVAQAGCTFRQLIDQFVPRGFLVPVSPGTGFATLGGALANDVHGKNHDRDGGFGRHVGWFDLVLASGELQRVSRASNAELFDATVGGCGLTGVIVRVALTLMPIAGNSVRVREQRVGCLDEFIDTLLEARRSVRYSVGWIDALQRGSSLGRGIVETADIEGTTLAPRGPSRFRMPFDAPSFALNRASVTAFNALYFRRVPARGRDRTVHLNPFFYPLDAITDWNRIYGRRGFYQFQCVVPERAAKTVLAEMLARIAHSGNASFLAVLKTLGDAGTGYLSFPEPGLTLALDFPNGAMTLALLRELEAMTLAADGRIYLAKDGCLSASGFENMYPRLDAFRCVLERVDPNRRFASDMSRRLGIHGAGIDAAAAGVNLGYTQHAGVTQVGSRI